MFHWMSEMKIYQPLNIAKYFLNLSSAGEKASYDKTMMTTARKLMKKMLKIRFFSHFLHVRTTIKGVMLNRLRVQQIGTQENKKKNNKEMKKRRNKERKTANCYYWSLNFL